jgi:hypothetical protein
MKELIVSCPQCPHECGVNLHYGDLAENSMTEGFICICEKCGCQFRFDVYVDVMNKEKMGK